MRRMATNKHSNSHNSTAKKRSASSAILARTKKAASKRSQPAAKTKKSKKQTEERPAWLKKRDELTLKMFQMVYESYQQGKFRRIL
jgi:hypothetical protein